MGQFGSSMSRAYGYDKAKEEEETIKRTYLKRTEPYKHHEDRTSRSIGHVQDLDKKRKKFGYKMFCMAMIISIIGETGEGKTTLLTSMMMSFWMSGYFKGGYTFATGSSADQLWFFEKHKRIPATHKAIDDWCDNMIERVSNGEIFDPNVLVLEDITGFAANYKGGEVRGLQAFVNILRHSNTTLITLSHTVSATMPVIRSNARLIFAFSSSREDHWLDIKKDYGMILPKEYRKKDAFLELVVNQCTKSQCLLFQRLKDDKRVFRFKSKVVAPHTFRMNHKVIKERKRKTIRSGSLKENSVQSSPK
jgi:hypothetical protein